MKNKERHQKTLSDRVIAKLKEIASQRARSEKEREQKAQATKAALREPQERKEQLKDGMNSYIACIESRITQKS